MATDYTLEQLTQTAGLPAGSILYAKIPDGSGGFLSRRIVDTDLYAAISGTTALTGAVQRGVTAKLDDVVSLKDFGAKVDGATDDSAAWQAAVDAAAALGFTLHIPRGVSMATGITIGHPIGIQFDDGATMKQPAAAPANTKMITIAADDVRIGGRGMIDGNRAAQVNNGIDLIFMTGRSRVVIEDLFITGSPIYGIHAEDCIDCVVQRCRVTDTASTAIQWFYNAADLVRCVTRDCLVDRSDDAANNDGCIKYSKAAGSTYSMIDCDAIGNRCTMSNAPTGTDVAVIEFWGAGRGCRALANRVIGGQIGISFANGQAGGIINGNRVYDFADLGLEVADSSGCTLSGNDVDGNGNGARGISIDGSSIAATHNVVSGNAIRSVTDSDIYFFAGGNGCAGSQAVGNALQVSAAAAHGVYNNHCDDILIAANSVDGSGTAGVGIVVDTASRVTVAGNNIHDFTAQSLQVLAQGVAVDEVTVTGGVMHSGASVQFLATGGGTFGARCKVLGVGGPLWAPADQVDLIKVAADGSYFVVEGSGNGSPDGIFAWGPGSSYRQLDGAPGAQCWVKESGTGNTGWRRIGNPLIVEVIMGFADLAAGAAKTLVTGIAGGRFKLRGLRLSGGGTNFDAGGDRDLSIQDASGAVIWSAVPAATLKALAFARWGDAGLPAPAAPGALTAESTAGDALVAKYSGGTTDYTAGALTLILEYERTT